MFYPYVGKKRLFMDFGHKYLTEEFELRSAGASVQNTYNLFSTHSQILNIL